MGWANQYIQTLTEQGQVSFRPRGDSMLPRIRSGQLCTLERVDQVEVGDIVLCKVNGHQYLHLVRAVRPGAAQIANNQGKINGWTSLQNVYGKLIRVED
jgi:phage repressor protein C with HTH and peptisase S24 domain